MNEGFQLLIFLPTKLTNIKIRLMARLAEKHTTNTVLFLCLECKIKKRKQTLEESDAQQPNRKITTASQENGYNDDETKKRIPFQKLERSRWDSNPQSPAPEASALSIRQRDLVVKF